MARFHLIQRFLALTGLLVAIVAAIICVAEISSWDRATIDAAANGQRGALVMGAMYAFAAGLGTFVVCMTIDVLVGVFSSAGRRSALGFNVLLQVALAIVLLVGVNGFSFMHYSRCDVTRDRVFTLKPETVAELRKIRADSRSDVNRTTVIVYQQHKTSARLTDKAPDRYDAAAERKVVEKVQDLVDQLREFGPQFRVVVLDSEEEGFDKKLADEVALFAPLDAAIKAAPESSIFFCAGNNVQRMGFSEFYQLDKTASIQANGGRGNLVLLNQGIEPFARRVLAIEEKKPRVALLTSHPWLSTEGPVDEYTLAGLRKSLTNYGFDVRDIITNKFTGRRGRGMRLEKAVLSIEESRLDRVEVQLSNVRLQQFSLRRELERFKKILTAMKEATSDADLDKRLSEIYGQRVTMPAEARENNLKIATENVADFERQLAQLETREQSLDKEFDSLQRQEKVVEGQREPDLKKKMAALLSDCDALIIPRMTLIDTGIGNVVPNQLHQLDDKQLDAVKEFMKAGKPVMFCVGPTNEQSEDVPGRPPTPPSDNLETLMAQVGLIFAPQAVQYDSEAEAYAANQVIGFGRGASAENIPPLEFPEGEVPTSTLVGKPRDVSVNPLGQALRLVQRSAGVPIELRLRYARPIYFQPLRGSNDKSASFLATIKASWNEDNPFPTEDRPIPRFEAPKADDPTRGTRNEKRRGPFPVGVAVETTLPITWKHPEFGAADAASIVGMAPIAPGGLPSFFAGASLFPPESFIPKTDARDSEKPTKVRLIAIGHGGWFSGPKLEPAQEALAVYSVNWLLGRDDRLPRADRVWQYPRVDLPEREQNWWRWGTILGLPALFAYFGFLVVMVRKLR